MLVLLVASGVGAALLARLWPHLTGRRSAVAVLRVGALAATAAPTIMLFGAAARDSSAVFAVGSLGSGFVFGAAPLAAQVVAGARVARPVTAVCALLLAGHVLLFGLGLGLAYLPAVLLLAAAAAAPVDRREGPVRR